ncbi:MAG: decaprenyl-phosphate phosphoribosyltransferase [Desulfobacterota bacterium]|nr:decaprenyl-phosphate phosphoribosyltransferase [Thermodesulfobacteriota bacterium]
MYDNTIVLVFKSMRPRQWTKNFIVFAPLIFSQHLFDFHYALKALNAFIVFCIISGCVYIANDIIDIEQDKKHPLKSCRPIASGKLSKLYAWKAIIFLGILAGIISWLFCTIEFIFVAGVYIALQIGYSLYLKHIVILDVFCIAAGFLLRVIAGAEALQVSFSTWLFICTILLSLFLALSKRRHELILLEADAVHHRKILFEYSPGLLDQMISIVTTSTVIAYILYTISSETIEKFGTDRLIYTTPFVLYGIFRYLYLIHQRNEGGSPEKVLLNDKPLLSAVILYCITACIVLYTR